VLQVSPAAQPQIVEAAYRRLARMYHPDGGLAVGSTVRMAQINAAYQVLRDPAARASYDASLGLSRAAAPRRSGWDTRLGLAALALIALVLAGYLLAENSSQADDRAELQAADAALVNAALTAQLLREELSGVQAQQQAAAAAATLELQTARATREALSAAAARQSADAEAAREAVAAQTAQVEDSLRQARLSATSEALLAQATREAEQGLARREAAPAGATPAGATPVEASSQPEALAAAPAPSATPSPAPPVAAPAPAAAPPPAPAAAPPPAPPAATPDGPPCTESDRLEIDGLLVEPRRRSDTVEYFGRARVRNGCDYPVRIQLVFEALGPDGAVILNGQTAPLMLAPGQASEVSNSIGFRPREDVASFKAFASVTAVGGN
jgi:curved DNA-binding protein CbpA